MKWLLQWLNSTGVRDGAIFRGLIGQNRVGERLHPDIIADIYKRVAAGSECRRGRSIKSVVTRSEWAPHRIFCLSHRSSIDHAVGPLEVESHADAIRGGNSRGAWRHGAGGKRAGEGFSRCLILAKSESPNILAQAPHHARGRRDHAGGAGSRVSRAHRRTRFRAAGSIGRQDDGGARGLCAHSNRSGPYGLGASGRISRP